MRFVADLLTVLVSFVVAHVVDTPLREPLYWGETIPVQLNSSIGELGCIGCLRCAILRFSAASNLRKDVARQVVFLYVLTELRASVPQLPLLLRNSEPVVRSLSDLSLG